MDSYDEIARCAKVAPTTVRRAFRGERPDIAGIRNLFARTRTGKDPNRTHHQIAGWAVILWFEGRQKGSGLKRHQGGIMRAAIAEMIRESEREFRRAFEENMPAKPAGESASRVRLKYRREVDRLIARLYRQEAMSR